MTDQARMKRNLILLAIGFVALIVGAASLINHIHKNSPEYTTNLVDRDTGEVLSTQPNKAPEGNAGGNSLTIFGSDQILKAGATSAQFMLVKNSIITYGQVALKGKYQTVSIIPSSLKTSAGDITGQLRLGQGDNIVNFEIKLSQLKYAQIIITDSSGQNGGNYDSGTLVVPTQKYQGTD